MSRHCHLLHSQHLGNTFHNQVGSGKPVMTATWQNEPCLAAKVPHTFHVRDQFIALLMQYGDTVRPAAEPVLRILSKLGFSKPALFMGIEILYFAKIAAQAVFGVHTWIDQQALLLIAACELIGPETTERGTGEQHAFS